MPSLVGFHKHLNLNPCIHAWVIVTTSYLSPNFQKQLSQHHFVMKHLLLKIQLFCCFAFKALHLLTRAPWLTLFRVTSQCSFLLELHAGSGSVPGLCWFSPCCSVFPTTVSIPEPNLLPEPSSRGPALMAPVLIASVGKCPVPMKCRVLFSSDHVCLYTHFALYIFLLECYMLFVHCLFPSPLVPSLRKGNIYLGYAYCKRYYDIQTAKMQCVEGGH